MSDSILGEGLKGELKEIVREVLREESNYNGHTVDSKEEQERLQILAGAKSAVGAGALLTAEQLAVMLQVNKATVYERVKKKTIPFYQVGRFVRFNLHEVLESERKKI
jgi:excisionase family DNA binding protein